MVKFLDLMIQLESHAHGQWPVNLTSSLASANEPTLELGDVLAVSKFHSVRVRDMDGSSGETGLLPVKERTEVTEHPW